MIRRIFLDTNIVIDYLSKREPLNDIRNTFFNESNS